MTQMTYPIRQVSLLCPMPSSSFQADLTCSSTHPCATGTPRFFPPTQLPPPLGHLRISMVAVINDHHCHSNLRPVKQPG
jgi:hypothetical protein